MASKGGRLDENAFRDLSTNEKIRSLQQTLSNGKIRILLNADEQTLRGIQDTVKTTLQRKGIYGQPFLLESVKNQVKHQIVPSLKNDLSEHLEGFDDSQK